MSEQVLNKLEFDVPYYHQSPSLEIADKLSKIPYNFSPKINHPIIET